MPNSNPRYHASQIDLGAISKELRGLSDYDFDFRTVQPSEKVTYETFNNETYKIFRTARVMPSTTYRRLDFSNLLKRLTYRKKILKYIEDKYLIPYCIGYLDSELRVNISKVISIIEETEGGAREFFSTKEVNYQPSEHKFTREFRNR